MSLLIVKNLCGGYNEVDIISGIDLTVEENEIVTIAGTNGAGKSTLIRAIMGLLPRTEGKVIFNDKDLLKQTVDSRLRNGVGYVPQVNNIFSTLTVLENLQAVEFVGDQKKKIQEMYQMFPKLADRSRTAAGRLSGGERQQLAFARALMSSPRLLLLDEPSAALSPALTEQVFDLVKTLPTLGVSVLMVEQRARQALKFSDRGYILDSGKVALSGAAAELLENQEMSRLYLGQG